MLHPAVGDQDPQRRQIRTDGDQPRHCEMTKLGQAVPAENKQTDESRFQEKRHQAFDGERRAEYVADIMRIVGPVGAELEFHGDAGGHPHGEIDAEQLAPKLRDVPPDSAASHHIDALHDRQQKRQAERQRHEQKMVQRRDGELQPIQADGIEMRHCSTSFASFQRRDVEGPSTRSILTLSAAGRALSGNMMSLIATMPTSLRRSTSTIAFANAVCGRKPAATKAASDEKIALIGTPREEQQTGVTASSMMQLSIFARNRPALPPDLQ